MRGLWKRVALAVLALSVGAGLTARAQSTGTLQGVVTDASGATVAGAMIILAAVLVVPYMLSMRGEAER